MTADWKDPSDARRLRDFVISETNARQWNPYRVVLLADEGLRRRQLVFPIYSLREKALLAALNRYGQVCRSIWVNWKSGIE